MVVFGQSSCNRTKWLYFGKSNFFRTKVDVLVQSDCFTAKFVVFGQKWLYSGKSGGIRAKRLS